MHCAACGAATAADARFCGACGAPRAAAAPERRRSPAKTLLTVVVVVILTMLLMKACAAADAPSSGNGTATATVPTIDPKVCDDALAELTGAGLIRERPAPNRANVDETLWAALPATQKHQVAGALRCSLTRGMPGDAFSDYAVVYGYRSGKRLAMAANQELITLE